MKGRFFLLSLVALAFSVSGWAQDSRARDYFARGKQAQASKNYLLAIENLKKATALDPSFAEAWYELGRCNSHEKNFLSAKNNFETCIEVSKTGARSGGVVHSRSCECGGTEYLECDVCDVFGYEQLYYPENKRVLCRTCGGTRHLPCPYGKVVSAKSASVKGFGIASYRQLGNLYFDEEDYENAKAWYDRYISASDEDDLDSRTWYNLARCENTLNNHNRAEVLLNKALYLDSTVGRYYLELADTYRKINYPDDALTNYQIAMRMDRGLKYESLVGIGDVYYDRDSYDTALIYFERALQIKKAGKVYFQLGDCYNSVDRYKDAVRVFKLAIQLGFNNDKTHTELSYAYYSQEQYDAAIAQLMPLMKKDPKNELSRFCAGRVYAGKGDHANLKKMIDELKALNSTDFVNQLTELLK